MGIMTDIAYSLIIIAVGSAILAIFIIYRKSREEAGKEAEISKKND
ncbi:MAG: hypothetical protein ACYCSS_08790 [Sulfuriferula sp.]